MQKTRERRSTFTPMVLATAGTARWDAFATECVSWMMTRAESGIRARATTGEGQLLAIFDVVGDWVDGRDHEAAFVVDAVLKLNDRHPVGRIVSQHAERVRAIVIDLGQQAGLVDVEEFAESWHILLRGAVMKASEGDAGASARAQNMGRDLIARHRPRPAVQAFAFDGESEFGWVEAAYGHVSPAPSTVPSTVVSTDARDVDWFDAYDWDEDYYAPVSFTA